MPRLLNQKGIPLTPNGRFQKLMQNTNWALVSEPGKLKLPFASNIWVGQFDDCGIPFCSLARFTWGLLIQFLKDVAELSASRVPPETPEQEVPPARGSQLPWPAIQVPKPMLSGYHSQAEVRKFKL